MFEHFLAVTFEIGGSDRDPKTPNNEEEPEWECVWKCHTATPVHHMSFSPDGTLFATSGKSDRLVKVWYESKHGELNKLTVYNKVLWTKVA